MLRAVMPLEAFRGDHGHRFIYDFTTLRALLDAAGFSDIRKCAFGQGATGMLFDSPSRAPESLYVEAGKCLGGKAEAQLSGGTFPNGYWPPIWPLSARPASR
jgi:hypothetical protein